MKKIIFKNKFSFDVTLETANKIMEYIKNDAKSYLIATDSKNNVEFIINLTEIVMIV